MQTIRSKELTADKKVVLFAVPGAFTPTCSLKHLPGFIEKAAEIKSKGVDVVACVAVNDAFVMDAWGKSVQADGKVMMIADGSAELAKSLGVELDLNVRFTIDLWLIITHLLLLSKYNFIIHVVSLHSFKYYPFTRIRVLACGQGDT